MRLPSDRCTFVGESCRVYWIFNQYLTFDIATALAIRMGLHMARRWWTGYYWVDCTCMV